MARSGINGGFLSPIKDVGRSLGTFLFVFQAPVGDSNVLNIRMVSANS